MKQTDWHLAGQCFCEYEVHSRNLFCGGERELRALVCEKTLLNVYRGSREGRVVTPRENSHAFSSAGNASHKDPRPRLITLPPPSIVSENEISSSYADLDIQRKGYFHAISIRCANARFPSFDFLSLLRPSATVPPLSEDDLICRRGNSAT